VGTIMAEKLTGGCACEAVRYECVAAPIAQVYCYCRDCQRASGGANNNAIVVPKDAFRVVKGAIKEYESTADSGARVRRGFCAGCGSPVIATNDRLSFVTISAGSLDDPNLFKPAAAIYVSSAPAWAQIPDGIPRFAKMPG
jgi:hypothetical protein